MSNLDECQRLRQCMLKAANLIKGGDSTFAAEFLRHEAALDFSNEALGENKDNQDTKCYEEFIALYNPLNIRLADSEITIKQQFVFAGWELAWKKIRQPVSLETCLHATARLYANWQGFYSQPASLRELVKCVLDTARIDYVN